ncbi:hypothetical protein LguiB_026865 [Lonicera macranthoides]
MSRLLLKNYLLFIFLIVSLPCFVVSDNVVNFGARAHPQIDSTLSFLRTWSAACQSNTPATVYVPRGTFTVKQLTFKGPCRNRVVFQIDGTLVAPWDYRALGNSEFWILFHQVNRLSVTGGTLDGRGSGFWNCRRTGSNCPTGAKTISFEWCNNVVVNGVTSLNSKTIHVTIGHCNNMRIQNVKIIAPSGSPNTDGIHVQDSTGITITGGSIRSGDDCISIGPGTRNMWIERMACGPGHGISIGSLGNSLNEAGVQNVTVTNTVFTKTDNGVRIKTWARASSGFATNIVFRDLIMKNVANPIYIDQMYCPNNQCPHQSSGVKISKVTYKNIKGTSSTQKAVRFECSSSNPCRGIKLQDIKLSIPNRATIASCSNAGGSSTGLVIPRSCL